MLLAARKVVTSQYYVKVTCVIVQLWDTGHDGLAQVAVACTLQQRATGRQKTKNCCHHCPFSAHSLRKNRVAPGGGSLQRSPRCSSWIQKALLTGGKRKGRRGEGNRVNTITLCITLNAKTGKIGFVLVTLCIQIEWLFCNVRLV